ncbi:hypothetical protein NDK43_24515 [Neobacillus pocheonensis]|uniref:Uncharacterized protein n=1 Tax=Neobacillus pocheonensis TaxID=363869 RepID=A0ABT0WF39_9BACI|nr:hypothetical protein [Neobacillus pocheonensis]
MKKYKGNLRTDSSRNSKNELLKEEKVYQSSGHQECIERAYRIPIFLSTTTHLNDKQQQFQNRLILEIENALLFPRTLPLSESYPEIILTDIRRLVSSSYGMLAVNFRRFFVEIVNTNVGHPHQLLRSGKGRFIHR